MNVEQGNCMVCMEFITNPMPNRPRLCSAECKRILDEQVEIADEIIKEIIVEGN